MWRSICFTMPLLVQDMRNQLGWLMWDVLWALCLRRCENGSLSLIAHWHCIASGTRHPLVSTANYPILVLHALRVHSRCDTEFRHRSSLLSLRVLQRTFWSLIYRDRSLFKSQLIGIAEWEIWEWSDPRLHHCDGAWHNRFLYPKYNYLIYNI